MSDATPAAKPVLWAHILDGRVAADPIPWAAGIDPNAVGGVWARVPAGTHVAEGMTFADGAFGPAPEPDAAALAAIEARILRAIDERAEALRLRLVTPGSGQAMEYQETYAQASAALAEPATATPERYPMLAATVGLDVDPTTGAPAADVLGVARSAVAVYDAIQAVGAALKGARLRGKAAVRAASTAAAKWAAHDAVAWPGLPTDPA